MTTSRSFEPRRVERIALDVSAPAATLTVTAADCVGSYITVSTRDNSGPSADAVSGAEFSEEGEVVTVALQPQGEAASNGAMTVINGLVFHGAVTVVNGRVAGGNGRVPLPGSSIEITARVPRGSWLRVDGMAVGVEVTGLLSGAQVRNQSGGVRLSEVGVVDIDSMSGSVVVGGLAGGGRINTMSGSIRVFATRPCALSATTMSGNVEVSGARVELAGQSMSGSVRNTSR